MSFTDINHFSISLSFRYWNSTGLITSHSTQYRSCRRRGGASWALEQGASQSLEIWQRILDIWASEYISGARVMQCFVNLLVHLETVSQSPAGPRVQKLRQGGWVVWASPHCNTAFQCSLRRRTETTCSNGGIYFLVIEMVALAAFWVLLPWTWNRMSI